MSMFDKLKFWKKDDLDFDSLAEKEMGMPMGDTPGFEQDNLGLDEKSPFPEDPSAMEQPSFPQRAKSQTSSFQQQQPTYREITPSSPSAASPSGQNRDLELINSKLDTLKAMLASMDQRMEHLERSSSEKKERAW